MGAPAVLDRLLPLRRRVRREDDLPVRAPGHLLVPRVEGGRPGQEGHLLQLPLRRQARGQGHDDGPRRQGAPPGREQPQQRAHYGGHGTGIAPYRSFWRRMFCEDTPFKYTGLGWLFMGVANSDAKLYDDELQEILKNYPDQFRVDYALSREQQNKDGGKMYIQDKVEEYGEEVFQLLQEGAIIYFCGLKGMMPGINDMLERVATSKGIEWGTFQKGLKKNGQYHVEVY